MNDLFISSFLLNHRYSKQSNKGYLHDCELTYKYTFKVIFNADNTLYDLSCLSVMIYTNPT